MFCEHCGVKKEERAIFCQNCGKKTEDQDNIISLDKQSIFIENPDVFYSENWRRKNVMSFASLPYFDIMVDRNYLYLIELPQYSGATIGLIIGLLVLNILGAAIGASVGGNSDAKKRKHYKSVWLSDKKTIISNGYLQDVLLKVPLSELKNHIIMNDKKFTLTYNSKKITLKKDKDNINSLNNHIQKYVL